MRTCSKVLSEVSTCIRIPSKCHNQKEHLPLQPTTTTRDNTSTNAKRQELVHDSRAYAQNKHHRICMYSPTETPHHDNSQQEQTPSTHKIVRCKPHNQQPPSLPYCTTMRQKTTSNRPKQQTKPHERSRSFFEQNRPNTVATTPPPPSSSSS
jgi:hypothetical protein